MRWIALFTFALLLGLSAAHQARASLVLAEFDVTHAVATTSTPIAVNNPTAGVISSALVPVGVNGNGASTPGLYWDASWTTSSTPNSLVQRLFFNVIPSPNVTVTFDQLQFYVNSGNSTPVGVELRVFGAGGSTLAAPQYLAGGLVLSANSATPVAFNLSSVSPLLNNNSQFSLTFFSRNPSARVGLSGSRSDIGVAGGNMFLTGSVFAVPEAPAWLSLGAIAIGCGGAELRGRLRRRRETIRNQPKSPMGVGCGPCP